jgi:hypothetical protein
MVKKIKEREKFCILRDKEGVPIMRSLKMSKQKLCVQGFQATTTAPGLAYSTQNHKN